MPNEVIKNPTVYGILGLPEASYGAGGAPSLTTDGLLLAELPVLAIDYAYDGTVPAPPGTTGNQRRRKPVGRKVSTSLKFEPKGAGVAYSASITPSIHRLLQMAGFTGAVTTTPGAEKWVYTPTPGPTGYTSGVFSAYLLGELAPISAAYLDFILGCDGAVAPIAEFPLKGLLGAISDQLVAPAITYGGAHAQDAPIGPGTFTLGNLTTVNLLKWSLKLQREIKERLNGTYGYGVGRRVPVLEVTYETPGLAAAPYTAAATIDPYQLYDSGAELAWSIQVGAVQYSRHKWSGPKAQLMAPPKTEKGDISTQTTLQIQLNPSALGANDELTGTFD